MPFVPFTIHVRVVPARPGKRFEYIRDLQKLSVLAYKAFTGISGVNVATPGGGQSQSMGDYDRRGGLGGFAQGTACKPQIGANPAQLMITGFYESANDPPQTYATTQRISGGDVFSGYAQHANDAVPAAAVATEVKTLKDAVETALAANLPVGATYEVFKIDYAGVVYGDKGIHFPRA